MATIGAMTLVEAQRLDLDRDVSDYLGFPLRNPHYPLSPITVRQLLLHTSSLRDGSAYSIPAPYTLREFFDTDGRFYEGGAHFAGPTGSVDCAPGRYFAYSNLNYGVLGTILERISGERFDQFMQRTVFTPLAIDGGYNVAALSDAALAQLATLYRRMQDGVWTPRGPWTPQVDDFRGVRPPAVIRVENPDTGELGGVTRDPLPQSAYAPGANGTIFSPQGGLRISARNLAKLMVVLMNRGRWQDMQLLQPESVQMMLTEGWRWDAGASNGDTAQGLMRAWGLSLQQFTGAYDAAGGDRIGGLPGDHFWGHLGEAYGLLSGMIFDPTRRVGFIYIIGGTGADHALHPGSGSSFTMWEEAIQRALVEEGVFEAGNEPGSESGGRSSF
ncbi:MAG: beta-lactamase family protein [Anaerolineales bacterium]|nr:beta-lactamase family protein [Anaerolineales bacterium]